MNRQRYPAPTIPVQRASAAEAAHKARYQVDITRQTQCSYRHKAPNSDAYLACVLAEGHPGMHCHAYITPSPTDHWYSA